MGNIEPFFSIKLAISNVLETVNYLHLPLASEQNSSKKYSIPTLLQNKVRGGIIRFIPETNAAAWRSADAEGNLQ